jgi:putative RecB family exonuclease
MQEHLSVSAINDYVDCGLLYKFSRLERIESEFVPDVRLFGSAIHKALAEFHQERMIGQIMTLETLQEQFEAAWRKAAKGNNRLKYRDGYDYDTCLKEGQTLLRVYHETNYDPNNHDNQYQVLAIEEPFQFKIEGLDIPLIGVMDLVEEDDSGTVVITDFKTTGRAYSADEVDQNFQLTVYHMAAKANGFGDREILLKFDCLIKTKTPRFERYYTTRGKPAESGAVKRILAAWDGIRKEVFIPNTGNWKCKGCAYQSACKEWLESDPGGTA